MTFERNPGLIALSRFGCGPRGDGDVAIAASDPRGLLKAELAQPGITLLSGPGLPATATAVALFYRDQEIRRMERREAAVQPTTQPAIQAPNPPPASAAVRAGAEMKPAPRPPSPEQVIFRDEALARIRRGIDARVGFAERLVAFWSNHFCVSVAKGGIARATAGSFEREAIRPHVLGRFADMLAAVESHPAMLHFLDNAQSVGPGSPAGKRGKRGLNENLGREIMELHTMGVGSGYSQADVTNLAKILTGWSFVGEQGVLGTPGTFVFHPAAHEPGPIALLGKTYPDDGVVQGQAALRDLARRPETAHFIAAKLAAAFVADVPPARSFHVWPASTSRRTAICVP